MKKLTPVRAIRQYCLDCSGFQPKEARLCPATDCPLFTYRLGKNPARKRCGSGDELMLEKTRVEAANSTNTEVLNESGAV